MTGPGVHGANQTPGTCSQATVLLLMLGDSPHIRTKSDKVNLKVFLSHCSSSTFGWAMAPGQGRTHGPYVGVDEVDSFLLIAKSLTSLDRSNRRIK